jgi:ubiquinone biosynthesis protein
LLVLMRAMALMENTMRCLDPEFNLVAGLLSRAEAVLKSTAGADADRGAIGLARNMTCIACYLT